MANLRVFFYYKNIKVEKRSCLDNELLDYLLLLDTDRVSVTDESSEDWDNLLNINH